MSAMDVRRRVGLNVQQLRRARGLSQEELAHRAQVHQTYLSGVETGRRNPSIVVLQRIAEALGSDIEDLAKRRSKLCSSSGARRRGCRIGAAGRLNAEKSAGQNLCAWRHD